MRSQRVVVRAEVSVCDAILLAYLAIHDRRTHIAQIV
jgi:hypothetical protein